MQRLYSMCRLVQYLVCLVVATWAVDAAAVVDIESDGDYVTNQKIEPVGQYFDKSKDGQIAYVGRQECLSFFDLDARVGFEFNLTTQGLNLLDSTRFFAVPTDVTPQDFSCDLDNTNNCASVDNIDAFDDLDSTASANVGQKIDFDLMVNDAVEGQQSIDDTQQNNGIELLANPQACLDTPVEQRYFFRLIFDPATGGSDRGKFYDAVVELDTKQPTKPASASAVVVTEGAVTLDWTQDVADDLIFDLNADATDHIRQLQPFVVYYATHDITAMSGDELEAADDVYRSPLRREDGNSSGPQFSGNATLDKLAEADDPSRVWLAVASRDDVGNVSEPTFPAGAGVDGGFEVFAVDDFWETYRGAGGQERGGCSQPGGHSPGPFGPVVAFIGLAGLMWRRRWRLGRPGAALVAAAFGLGVLGAGAQPARAASPTYGIAELRLGFYYPSVDSEPGLSGRPFHQVFGDGHRLMVEYEQGYHFFDGFGALGASGTVGYTSFGGDALLPDDVPDDADVAGGDTSLAVFPLAASIYYRFDVFEKRWNIPVVPTGQAGLDYMLWSVDAPDGDTASYGGDDARGGTWGWHGAVGLHILLDWIDASNAALLDRSWGINNTYAFVEWRHQQIDDFGAADSFRLSDNTWACGLAFEY